MPGKLLCNCKSKDIFGVDADTVHLFFKDEVIAFNGIKKAMIANKGVLTNKISAVLFEILTEKGIPNHFVERVDERRQLCKKTTALPLVINVHNYATKELCRRFSFREGEKLNNSILELIYNDGKSEGMLINNDYALALKLCTKEELSLILQYTRNTNKVLTAVMAAAGIILARIKLGFGRDNSGTIVLNDEISPDTCRLWDIKTKKKLDIDRFCYDLGQVIEAYENIYHRLENNKWVKK